MGKEAGRLYLDRDTIRLLKALSALDDLPVAEIVREGSILYALQNKHQDVLVKIFGLDFLKHYRVETGRY